MTGRLNNQKGGVSIFIVIFACLLVTIVTVSFVSIMIRNQQQATNADLSASAYDSAMSGVEDAKRLAILYRDCKASGDTTDSCNDAIAAVDSNKCNTIQKGLYGSDSTDEIKIKSDETADTSSSALDQAYTCLKINYYTSDIRRSLDDNETQMIPLRSKGNATFDRIKVSWHKQKDPSDVLKTSAPGTSLPQKDQWKDSATGVAWPAILRTQLLQTAPTFTLDDFNGGSGVSDTNTLFLYPGSPSGTGLNSTSFALDSRPASSGSPRAPQEIKCNSAAYAGGDYGCSTFITLPRPVGGSASDRRNAYLLLSSIYNSTDYKIELYNGGGAPANKVDFDGVQPEVDSTGRANDLFRRVDARIEFDPGQFNYPSAALDLDSGLCKAFSVTDSGPDFRDGGCTP